MPAQPLKKKNQRAERGRRASDLRDRSRMPRFNQRQQRRLFSSSDQLLSHLEGDDSADTKTRQTVGSGGLQSADLFNAMFGDRLNSLQGFAITLKTDGLKNVYRLVGT